MIPVSEVSNEAEDEPKRDDEPATSHQADADADAPSPGPEELMTTTITDWGR